MSLWEMRLPVDGCATVPKIETPAFVLFAISFCVIELWITPP